MLYIVKIAIETNLDASMMVGNYEEIVIAYCIIKAKPDRCKSNLQYLFFYDSFI